MLMCYIDSTLPGIHRIAFGRWYLTASASFLLLCSADIQAQAPRVATSRTLSGRVVAAATGEPLANARVVVKGTSAWTRSDVSGRFSLSVPVPSAVIVMKAGYLDVETAMNVQPQNASGPWDGRMTSAAAIYGRVIDERGDPGVNLSVNLIPKNSPGARIPVAITDDRGAYRFGSVRQGTYTIAVTTDDAVLTSREVAPGLFSQSPTYVKTYYGDTRSESDAAPVTVAAGDERGG